MDSSISLTTPAAPTLPPSPGTLADRISSLGERARAGEAGARGELSRACEMLEAHFVTWLLREMRATVPQDDGLLPHDASNETYDALFDDSLARTIAHGGGIGLARALEARLAPRVGLAAEGSSDAETARTRLANPQSTIRNPQQAPESR